MVDYKYDWKHTVIKWKVLETMQYFMQPVDEAGEQEPPTLLQED